MLTRILRTGAAVPAELLVATGAVTLPGAALVACVALGVVAGALGGAWAWLTADPPDRSSHDVAPLTGAVAIAGGLALVGMTVLLGPGTSRSSRRCTARLRPPSRSALPAGAGSPLGGLWQPSETATDRPLVAPSPGLFIGRVLRTRLP